MANFYVFVFCNYNFTNSEVFHPKPWDPWFRVSHIARLFVETWFFFQVFAKPTCPKWPDERVLDSMLLVKNGFTIVFTSRIEVFVVKPAFGFSFVVSSFHKDLFSEGAPRGFFYVRKNMLLFSEERARTTTGAFLAGFSEITCTLYFRHHLGDF